MKNDQIITNALVDCFNDTMRLINTNDKLLQATNTAMSKTRFCPTDKNELQYNINKETANITVIQDTTFHAAGELVKNGDSVAVLNFASAVNPGGGVTIGVMAQEECLCRSSNLLPCLKQKRLMDEFYMPNRIADNHFYNDNIIYTKSVTVFKNDDAVPVVMSESDWFNVDVITCAAPNMRNVNKIDKNRLYSAFCSRIKAILDQALLNGADSVVLGAFGCGAFENPPETVARAFKYVIEKKYLYSFKNILFAIKGSSNNIFEVFHDVFNNEKGQIIKVVSQDEFLRRKENNPYYGKNFSIFGDSISTLEGYIPEDYKAFYDKENCEKAEINSISDTWWGKVITYFGGNLLVNNSYSGSKVTSAKEAFPSGISKKRISGLSKDGVNPDVIIVYMGFNDWAKGVPVKAPKNPDKPMSVYFDYAYFNMIIGLSKIYPDAEIWCCTLNPTYVDSRPDFEFPYEVMGINIEEYNSVIRSAAVADGRRLIDLFNNNMPNDTLDGSHPNQKGMDTLAKSVCLSVVKDEALVANNEFFNQELVSSVSEGEEYDNGETEKRTETETTDGPVNSDNTKKVNSDSMGEKAVFCSKCGSRISANDQFCMNCGEKTVGFTGVDAEDSPIEIIDNRYELIRLIGKGASSTVYLARDKRIDRVCAVKVVNKSIYSNIKAVKELLNEANKMKQLAHVSIPQLYDICDENNRLCIIMEYVEGKPMDEIIAAKKVLDEHTVIKWAKQLCRVLHYLHTLNPPRIFRDLKPNNIMIQSNGIVKLIDFGTMKIYDDRAAEDTVNLGTRGYAAPEQFGGRGITDARTDIYGLGMTMYHLLIGINPAQYPFDFKPISDYRQDISKKMEAIVMKCISLERENRYQSAVELLQDLEELDI